MATGSLVAAIAAAAVTSRGGATTHATATGAAKVQKHLNYNSRSIIREKLGSGEADQGGGTSPAEETYDNRAYPATRVAPAAATRSRAAYGRATTRRAVLSV